MKKILTTFIMMASFTAFAQPKAAVSEANFLLFQNDNRLVEPAAVKALVAKDVVIGAKLKELKATAKDKEIIQLTDDLSKLYNKRDVYFVVTNRSSGAFKTIGFGIGVISSKKTISKSYNIDFLFKSADKTTPTLNVSVATVKAALVSIIKDRKASQAKSAKFKKDMETAIIAKTFQDNQK